MYKQIKFKISRLISKRFILFVFIFSLLLLGSLTYRFALQNNWLENEYNLQLQHVQFNNEIAELNYYIKSAESANRGYAFKGNKEFVISFDTTIDSINSLYRHIRNLENRKTNPAFAPLFLRVDSLIQQKVAFMKLVKSLSDNHEYKMAADKITTREGRHLADTIAALHKQISNNISEGLKSSQTGFLHINRNNNNLAYTGIGIAMLLIILTFYLLLIEIRKTKKTSEELKVRKELYKVTINSLSEGLILTDKDGSIVYLNPAAEKLTGWSWQDAQKQPLHKVFNVVNEESGKPIENVVSRIINNEKNVLWENNTLLKAKDSGTFIISNSGTPTHDEKGNVSGAVLLFNDITELKKAEDELRLSESRTRKIFEFDMIGFMYWDINGEILDANDRFLKMTGYSKQDLHENKINWSKMTPPEYAELDRIALEQVASTGYCLPYDKEYIRKDGSRMPVLLGGTAFDGNNPEMGVAYVMDISERKKAEKNLAESKNYLRTILETEPECVKVLNRKGELLSMNPAGLAMIEADNEQQVLGHCMTELVDEKYRAGFTRLSKEVFNGHSGTFEFQITGLKGGHHWLETHAVPLKDSAGKITNLLGVTRNITERKKAEEEITNTTEQLRQLTAHLQNIREEERTHMAREIHDELGQQLTVMKMDVAWLNDKVGAYDEKIKARAIELQKMLDHTVVTVRRLAYDLRPSMLDDMGLGAAIEWQLNEFKKRTGTSISFERMNEELDLTDDIKTGLFRIVQESLTNVSRYAQAKNVSVSLKQGDKNLHLTITDDGIGFENETIANKRTLGIIGVKERAANMGGDYKIVSKPNKGTSIQVTIPNVV